MAMESLFEKVYRDHAGAIYRFLLGLSGNHAMAQDLAAETFVRAWAGVERIRMPTVKAYLYTIARNLYYQSLRHGGREMPLPPTLEDPGTSADAHALSRSELAAVARELARLSEGERTALLLRSEGLSYEEIAAKLGLNLSAAKVRVHRARVKLQRRCQESQDRRAEA